MSLHDVITQDQRAAILLTLGEADGYRLNDSVLRSALSTMALPVGRDEVRGQLDWLQRQGLVRVERLQTATSGELWIATLTASGDEVRQGRPYPGVKRAGPV
jgi:hypothetical protein